jgi:hypothetical protein
MFAAGGVAVLPLPDALARATFTSAYGFDRTWNAAVRFVRVDNGFRVNEKDDAGGYLLFEYVSSDSGGKPTPGSIEVIRSGEPGDPVQVVVQLPKMPSYHEQSMVAAFARKLKDELGDPPVRTKRAPSNDDGPDGG